MMLVHVSDDGQSVYIMSFPRDLYVDIPPGFGKDRINAALAFGGVSLAVTTVENYVGVPIDHVALIDFDGIQGLVDTLGGIDVEVPISFTAGDFEFTEGGTQHLNGEEALAFVRSRKQFSDGDFQRNRNQQLVLKAIAAELISRDTLTDPAKLRETVSSIAPLSDDRRRPDADGDDRAGPVDARHPHLGHVLPGHPPTAIRTPPAEALRGRDGRGRHGRPAGGPAGRHRRHLLR